MTHQVPLDGLHALVRRLSAHSPIGAEEERAILTLPTTVVRVKTQADFVRAGSVLDHSCLVEDGLVARYEQFDDGRRQIFSLHIPGDFVDLQSLLIVGAPAPLQAVCASTIVKVPHAALRVAIERLPSLGTVLWRDTTIDAAILGQAVARIGRRDAYSRMAHLICELAVRYDRVGRVERSRFRLPITQEQLADVLGLTSVHVNRTIKALRGDGLVEIASGYVQLRDWRGLRQAAGFDPAYLGPEAQKAVDAVA